MAVDSIPVRASCTLVVNKGTNSSTGKMITGNVSIPGLRDEPDDTKLYAVASLLSPCLAYPVVKVQKTLVSELEQD